MPDSRPHSVQEVAQTLSTPLTTQCVAGMQVRATEGSAQA